MYRLRPVAAALAVFTTAAFMAGCQPGGFSGKSAQSKQNVFRYTMVTSPTSLDPGKVQDGDTIDAVQQVYEGLVGWGVDNKVNGILADKWEVQDGGRVYVFTLRPNLKFTSGNPITAQTIKDSIERNCNPKFNSPTAGTYLTDIVGVKERLANKAPSIKGITVVNPTTLRIEIDKPRPYFLGKLTYPITYALDLKSMKDPTKELTNIKEMIGSGPYKISEFVPDQVLKLAANKEYWNGAPKIDGIERPIVKDAATRLNMFKTGEVDLVQLERQDLKGVNDDPKLKAQLVLLNRPAMWYLGMNCDMYPALKDRRVRQAIAMSIDRDDIVDNLLGGVNTKAYTIVPPGVLGYREGKHGLAYDPTAARRLLAEAGYPDGKGFPKMELYHREARPDIALVANKVATDLKKNLGLDVTPRQMEWRAYLEKNNAKQLPFFHMRWGADYLDAENFLSTLLASYGAENKVNYKNPEYDALCARADSTLDEAERLKLYAQAEDIVLNDAPFVPIYFQRDAELISPRVKGLRESVFGHLPHTTVTLQ